FFDHRAAEMHPIVLAGMKPGATRMGELLAQFATLRTRARVAPWIENQFTPELDGCSTVLGHAHRESLGRRRKHTRETLAARGGRECTRECNGLVDCAHRIADRHHRTHRRAVR